MCGVRRSSRTRVPALTPEERMMTVVERARAAAGRSDGSLVDDDQPVAAPSQEIREEENVDPLPTASQPAGSIPVAPTALPASQGIDHPIEGPDWKESDIMITDGFGDEVLQQTLRNAADAGQVFNERAIQGMRVLGVTIAAATDRPPSARPEENGSGEIGTTPVTRPSSDGNVQNHCGPREPRIRETPNLGTQAQTMRSVEVLASASDANPATDALENAGNLHDELAVLAIGVRSATGEMKQVVTSMNVTRKKEDSGPSVARVMEYLKEDEEAKTYDLRQLLGPMSSDLVEIRTARKPLRIREVAEMRDGWCDESQVLGKLNEVDKLRERKLVPCVPCQEADMIRRAAGVDASSSAPIFVIYIFEVEGTTAAGRSYHGRGFHGDNSASAEVGRNYTEEGSSGRTPEEGRGSEEARNYLKARLNEEDFGVYQRHVRDKRGGQGAYPIIIFARLVERGCERLRIPFSTGSSTNKSQKMGNGPRISMADIVLFYGTQFPSDSAPVPSTFVNHRSVYLRAKSCVVNLENRELSEEDKMIWRSLKKIVETPLTGLAVLQPEEYGSLSTFKTWIDRLEKRFNKKGKGKAI